MATKKQKEELMEVLKFTPRTYTVRINGYGGEIVMGKVDRKVVDYFRKKKIDLEIYASSWGEPGDEDYIDVPEELQPFSQGNWYDCDNIEHNSGAEWNGAWIIVEDENGNEILETELGTNLEEQGCEVECFCEEDIQEHCQGDTAVFVGQNFEKGCFFEAEFELRQPFDISKFKFTYSEIAGWPVLNLVEYDGEELDGSNGYSTNGKSASYCFYYEDAEGEIQEYNSPDDDDEDIPVLEGEEEWASRVIDESREAENTEPSDFMKLAAALAEAKEQTWNDVSEKPPAKGEYECEFETAIWPSGTIRNAEWTGRSWKEKGKKASILRWREIEE